jgi:hypothetical protein
MTCDAHGCQRKEVLGSQLCKIHGGVTITNVVTGNINDHRVKIEDEPTEGLFYCYCTKCDTGHTAPNDAVENISGDAIAKGKKYMMAIFMKTRCDSKSSSQAGNINIAGNAGQSGDTIQISDGSDDVDAQLKQDILRSMQRKMNRNL